MQWDLLRFSIFLTTGATPLLAQSPAKAGSAASREPITITIQGLRDENIEKNCLRAINRYRKNPLLIAEKGDGDYQVIIEKKHPGYQVRVEKQGTVLRTGRALHDFEVCIAAAAIARDAIVDE
jgi:hypothetical protein